MTLEERANGLDLVRTDVSVRRTHEQTQLHHTDRHPKPIGLATPAQPLPL